MTVRLMEGSEAIAEAMVAAGCSFFAGYPMTPFTEVLEHMARLLPETGGVCMNAESELEAVGMVWGAAAAGARAATGSVGQGLSLMQESLSEMCFAKVPAVIINMARGQGDYFQATRGGGHGDYRHIVLAPCDAREAARLIQLAFHLADEWRNPVMFMGDYYLAHVQETVEIQREDFGPVAPKSWALDGTTSGSGDARIVSPVVPYKRGSGQYLTYGQYLETIGPRIAAIAAGVTPMAETLHCDDAELVVAAYGTPARTVRYVVSQLREEGLKVGFFRPITLWPFPERAVFEATRSARRVAVYELNTGQMYDDVRLSVRDREIEFIGGVSYDLDAFGVAPALTPANVARKVREMLGVSPKEFA
jgi:2-oxoglutarate ferredoxin oxidoreductase subunit alpha